MATSLPLAVVGTSTNHSSQSQVVASRTSCSVRPLPWQAIPQSRLEPVVKTAVPIEPNPFDDGTSLGRVLALGRVQVFQS
jgi:hypothetical protein